MSAIKLRPTMLAFRVLAALHAADGYALDEAALIAQVAGETRLSSSAIRGRSWQIIAANMVVVRDGRWLLLTAGVTAIESRAGAADALLLVTPTVVPKPVGQVALPRTIQNGVTSARPLASSRAFVHVRPDGLTFRAEPSLMGATRRLRSGEVVL
jgi:hypothetical protein